MKGFKITNINFHQAVALPAGVYTYSCKATPVGSSITFRVGSTDYVIGSLTPGVYQKGIKKTFTIETDQSYFYPSRTVGDEIFEPQLEEGTVATTAGPHILDASEEVSRAGIEINDEMVRTYATKVDVSSEIIQTAESINTRVSNAEGRIGAVEVAADSINTRVSNAEGWIGEVEVTPASINSSVTKSGQIASQILQEDGTVKITGEKIDLTGSETASGKFIVDVNGKLKAKEAEIEGKIMSSSSGNRILIDPDDKSVKLIDSNDETLSNIGFKEVTEGSQTFNQPYIEQLSPAIYSFTPKSFFRPSYIELTNVTGFQNTSFVFDAKNSQIILGLSGSSPGTLKINIKNLPTSASGLSAGDLYRDSSGYLKIV